MSCERGFSWTPLGFYVMPFTCLSHVICELSRPLLVVSTDWKGLLVELQNLGPPRSHATDKVDACPEALP
jgi:hypothetical protein